MRIDYGSGDDYFGGAEEESEVHGAAGHDVLQGGTAVFYSDGYTVVTSVGFNDTLDGGGGNDTASYSTWFNDGALSVVYYTYEWGLDVNGELGEFLVWVGHNETLTGGIYANLALGYADGAGHDILIGIENLVGSMNSDTLIGDGGANGLYGGRGDDSLVGGGGDDTLDGGADDWYRAGAVSTEGFVYGPEHYGRDTLDGGAGKDRMSGGVGDDTYYVDNGGDVVIELAGEGYDVVFASNTFTATGGSEIEKLVATGTGNVALTGNGRVMEIIGNAGINTLDDGNGAATLSGGAGGDVYLVHNAATQVIELVGEGYDTVKTDLAAYTLAANVEVLTRLGSADFHGTGNALANAITGGAGNDVLNGAGGNDFLTGGLGADTFAFDNLTSGMDWITDFKPGQDLIGLSAAGFGLSSLGGVALVAGDAAVAAGHAALHYYANGAISFDANGGSLADAVTFAGVQGHPALSIGDFVLV